MTVSGRQIREARELLGWSRADLAVRAFLPLGVIEAAEERDRACLIVDGQALAIRRVCERAGVEFTVEGVRLKVGR